MSERCSACLGTGKFDDGSCLRDCGMCGGAGKIGGEDYARMRDKHGDVR